ncbi:MAG: hypothetical protein IJF78_10040 [Clostridia bacterium]|nr:hypothetical protein [Clostridia bacterium]
MKRKMMLFLALLLLTGCGKTDGPERVVLEYAYDSVEVVLPSAFYPDYLTADAVFGRGADGMTRYDGESQSWEAGSVSAVCDIDGGIAAAVTVYADGEPGTEVRFLTDNADASVPITFGSFTTDEIGGTSPEIFGLYPTDTGAALITQNEVIAVTPGGIQHRESVRQVISVNCCPDGVCVLAYDDVADRHVYLLNGEGGLDEVSLTLPEKAMTAFFLADGKGFYADAEGIFSLNGSCVMNFSQSGWLPEGIREIRMDSEDAFTILGTHAGTGEYGAYEMKKSAGTEERILVEAVYDENAGRKLPEAAAMFNASSEEYFVQCTKLAESDGSLSAVDKILLGDEIPDLAVLAEGTPLDDYINKEVFLDLSAYLDPAVFMDCAGEALLTDGKLYTVSGGFSAATYSGRAEFLPDTWTYEDLFALHGSLGEEQRMVWSGSYTPDFLCGSGSLIQGDTVDTETLAKLYDLLSFQPAGQGTANRLRGTELYVTGQVLLKSMLVNSVDTYVMMKAYAGWEEPRIIGYPSASGSVHRIAFDNRMSVFADGDCPDGAAEFIEYLIRIYPLTPAGRDFCSIPTVNDCWDGWIGFLQQSGIAFAFEPGSGEWWPWDSQTAGDCIVVKPDDEVCSEFRDWLNGITPASPIPDQVYAILTEELSAVTGGSVSPEEGAERAAGRIRLYLSEKS